MIDFRGRLILLDVEGTVVPLSFVQEVLFPYARTQMPAFLSANADALPVQNALEQMARDAGKMSFSEWCTCAPETPEAMEWVTRAALQSMNDGADQKGLKALQELIWEQGFRTGDLHAAVFPDVPPALAAWSAAGRQVRIHSSGSTSLQKFFFTHTDAGDLTRYLSGYYDSTIGLKTDTHTYAAIAIDAGLPAREILYLSDLPEELDAAHAAGLATGLAVRPGNRAVAPTSHTTVHTLDEIELS
jgi:enolase-phosphatase E1